MEFRNFKISKCAFHQIFQRVEKDKIIPPYYSDSCEILTRRDAIHFVIE